MIFTFNTTDVQAK